MIFNTPPVARSSTVITALPALENSICFPAIVIVPANLRAESAVPERNPLIVPTLKIESMPPTIRLLFRIISPPISIPFNIPSSVIFDWVGVAILPTNEAAVMTEPMPPVIAFPPNTVLPFKFKELKLPCLMDESIIVEESFAITLPVSKPATFPNKLPLILGTLSFS